MEQLDWLFLAGYLLFMFVVALLFRRFATNASEFIQAGGAMMWWMAGATAFMTQFSAWTFTGAAAKAFEDGFSVLFVFWGNALGFFLCSGYFASRYRRLRVATSMEVIKLRFGKSSEQVFTWLSFPVSLIACAIWLNGLGAFVSATLQLDLYFCIIAIGLFVLLIAFSGGAWTVSATNVIQLIVLLAVTTVVGAYAGVDLIQAEPVNALSGSLLSIGEGIGYWQVFAMWACVMLMQQTISTNNALSAYRFLVTINEQQAVKAARLAGLLFLFAPLLWFAPAWMVASTGVSLQQVYPNLAEQANNAAYLYYIVHYMPQGLLGLVVVAMVAATVAPMTAALNRNAGIVVKNVYLSLVNPEASQPKQLRIGQFATLLSGILALLVAVAFASIETYSLFELMMLFSAFVQMPLSIPSILALVVVKTPGWSGWASILVGLLVSVGMYFGFDVNCLLPWFGETEFSHRERVDLHIVASFVAQLLITGGFFICSGLFYQPTPSSRDFRRLLDTPMSAAEQAQVDTRQGRYLGRLSMSLGGLLLLVALWQTESRAQLIYALIGALVCLAGMALSQQGRQRRRVSGAVPVLASKPDV